MRRNRYLPVDRFTLVDLVREEVAKSGEAPAPPET